MCKGNNIKNSITNLRLNKEFLILLNIFISFNFVFILLLIINLYIICAKNFEKQ